VRTVRFLFLPAEHDPDSYIREFGRDAFSRYVSDATPLSRFLVEVAREGCDLASSEGRAHMAANAKPLWTALPDGVLKRQLLSEIAGMVQLDPQELSGLWGARPPAPYARAQGRAPQERPRPWRRPSRTLPPGRADRALQIVLLDPGAWGTLGHEDHQLLCELAPPHGPLFGWLDSHVHEHGPEPWEALKAALQDHEFAAFALDQVGKVLPDIEHDLSELRQILQMERDSRLDEERKELSARAATDPQAYERLKQLWSEQKPPSAS
jgi:DNA primase